MILPVTILYGTLSILVTLALALNVSLYRLRHRIFVGADSIPATLHRAVRAHGNSAEWLAVNVLLLAFLELQRVPPVQLHVLGGCVLAARLAHSAFMLAHSRFTVWSAVAMYTIAFWMVFTALRLRLF